MRVPDFSEFTFGYALTDNLIRSFVNGVKGVPIFPSLYEEGQPGVGYDVKIPRYSAPLFLQFKLPQVIKRHRKVWGHELTPTYYRLHLMRGSDSTQHASLLQLARRGREVYYVAPEFHRRRNLDEFYRRGEVPLHSAFFNPVNIGRLDSKTHHIAYKRDTPIGWLCSDPIRLEKPFSVEFFLSQIRHAVSEAHLVESREVFFDQLVDEILYSATTSRENEPVDEGRQFVSPAQAWQENEVRQIKINLSNIKGHLGSARFAGYVAQMFLDCRLFVVGHDEGDKVISKS